MPNRDAYIQRMRIQLDELNAGINKLEETSHRGQVAILDDLQSEVTALRAQSQMALLKLDEIKSTEESSWENLKADLEKSRDTLAYALHDAKARD